MKSRLPYPTGGRFADNDGNQRTERTTPTAEDDAGTINIPQDQVHPSLANSPHPGQTARYQVQINGRTEEWDVGRLIQEAQKSAAAQEKFQEASELRKEASQALSLKEDLETFLQDEDPDAFRRLGASLGVPGDKVEDVLSDLMDDEDDEEDDDEDIVDQYYKESSQAGRRGEPRSRNDGPVDYSKLSPDIQRVLFEAEKGRVGKIVDEALDKDEVIAYNMKAHTPEGRAAIRRFVDDKIRGRLSQYGGDFGDGTRILSEVLPEVRGHLEALGIPGQRTHAGLGQSPGGGDTEVYPRQKPDHVPSTEGDMFDQNILETLQYHQSQAERGSR